jgi:hypothetical protein
MQFATPRAKRFGGALWAIQNLNARRGHDIAHPLLNILGLTSGNCRRVLIEGAPLSLAPSCG